MNDFQQKTDQWIRTTGKNYFSILTNLGILTEEVGELAKVIVRHFGEQSFKKGEHKKSLEEEFADVLFVLCALANQSGVCLEKAFYKRLSNKQKRDKERHQKNPKIHSDRYRIYSLKHTADIAFRVRSQTIAGIFEGSLAALQPWIAETFHPLQQTYEVRLEGSGYEVLLISWLNEALYLCETQYYFPIKVTWEYLTPCRLSAHWHLAQFSNLLRHIKAATFHGDSLLTWEKNLWCATVVLDV